MQSSGPPVQRCRACGCTDLDCSGCIERTGSPCFWVEPGLCSACAAVEVELSECGPLEPPAGAAPGEDVFALSDIPAGVWFQCLPGREEPAADEDALAHLEARRFVVIGKADELDEAAAQRLAPHPTPLLMSAEEVP